MKPVLCVLLLLTAVPVLTAGEATVIIADVPHVVQRPDFCGEACTAMVLGHLGHKGTQEWVFDHAGLDPLLGRGCYTGDLVKALKEIGFDAGQVWYKVEASAAADGIRSQWQAVYRDLVAGRPSIVCMRCDDRPRTTEHMRLVVGYDADTGEVIYHEPASAGGAYNRMKLAHFLDLWPLKYSSDEWTVIRFRMVPVKLKPYTAPPGFTDADHAQHCRELKVRLPGPEFSVFLQRPFVVIGDEPADIVRQSWSEGTVKRAVTCLKTMYFIRDPLNIIDIWLFKDDASYRAHTRELWGHAPSTPYGYYSSRSRVLVMNIATGGGTLVHEIVHPFIEANFPECPGWFNEGLGSLYEQCRYEDTMLVGLTNWRLAGLQQAIRAGELPSFKALTEGDFYTQPYGYAHARYLCYYLQQHGLLVDYYIAFRENVKKDPSGYRTLQTTLDVKDMDAFQKAWEKWVLGLRFPPST